MRLAPGCPVILAGHRTGAIFLRIDAGPVAISSASEGRCCRTREAGSRALARLLRRERSLGRGQEVAPRPHSSAIGDGSWRDPGVIQVEEGRLREAARRLGASTDNDPDSPRFSGRPMPPASAGWAYPLFFASAIVHRGYAHPVLVESHMGRPTKIEGNPDHPASLGAADSFTQAALLDLYDPDRAKTVTYRGEVRSWSNFLTAAQGALTSQKSRQGAGLRFLTGPITSPSLAELMATVLRDYPQAKWHQFDPAGMQGRPGRAPHASRLSLRQGGRHRRTRRRLHWIRAGERPLSARLRRPAADHRRAQGDEPPLFNREHAHAHRRQGRSSSVCEGIRGGAIRGRAGGGNRIAPSPRRARRSPVPSPEPLAPTRGLSEVGVRHCQGFERASRPIVDSSRVSISRRPFTSLRVR